MKRVTIMVPSMPVLIGLVFAIFLGMGLSTFFTAQIANGANPTPNAVVNGPLTGCVGNSTASAVKLNLAGRVITPSTLLRLEASGNCAQTESSVSWNTLSDIQYSSVSINVPGLTANEIDAYCPYGSGKQATSGGFKIAINQSFSSNIHITENAPVSDNYGNYWAVTVANFNDPNQANTTANVTVYAVCQTVAPGVVPHAPAPAASSKNSSTPVHPTLQQTLKP